MKPPRPEQPQAPAWAHFIPRTGFSLAMTVILSLALLAVAIRSAVMTGETALLLAAGVIILATWGAVAAVLIAGALFNRRRDQH